MCAGKCQLTCVYEQRQLHGQDFVMEGWCVYDCLAFRGGTVRASDRSGQKLTLAVDGI